MAESVRAELVSLYQAAGFTIEGTGASPYVDARRVLDEGGERFLRISLPLEAEPHLAAETVLADVARWKSRNRDGIYIVALPTLLSLGAPFQTAVRDAGALLRTHASLLDAGFGGTDDVGFGQPPSIDRIRERLFDYSRVDTDLLQAVVRTQHSKRALAGR